MTKRRIGQHCALLHDLRISDLRLSPRASSDLSKSVSIMRLLNSTTLQLENFSPNAIPNYAILSHTWEDDEVLFTDIGSERAKSKSGYYKIWCSCKQASHDGIGYVWVDTCCIDKSSDSELSEAINSMFAWYKRAQICYAYLADVPEGGAGINRSQFAASRWFTRGWTLQELIAPRNVQFYSAEWVQLGTKSSLSSLLSYTTGIDMDILSDRLDLDSVSIAKRMSWASQRETTRPEDIAYCLMGIFSVHMPLLYGVGERAFIRLQEEIMRYTDDRSLFAWTDPTADPDSPHELLATSPSCFMNSSNIQPYTESWSPVPYFITNKGLRIDLRLSSYFHGVYTAALDCISTDDGSPLGIYVRPLSLHLQQYARVYAHKLAKVSDPNWKSETVYVRQHNPGLRS